MGPDLLQGQRIQLLATDPPYNVAYQGKAGKIANDDLSDAAFQHLLVEVFRRAHDHAHPGASVYCCYADSAATPFRAALAEAGWDVHQTLIWVKNALVLGRSDYQWRHEPILYGWMPGKRKWHGGRKQTTVWQDHGITVVALDDGRTQLTVTDPLTGKCVSLVADNAQLVAASDGDTSIWNIDKPQRNIDHPTTKPCAIYERMLANSSDHGDQVCDPFAGSGTCVIAAERLSRRARVVELSPAFADVIIARWESFTGRGAERIDKANT